MDQKTYDEICKKTDPTLQEQYDCWIFELVEKKNPYALPRLRHKFSDPNLTEEQAIEKLKLRYKIKD